MPRSHLFRTVADAVGAILEQGVDIPGHMEPIKIAVHRFVHAALCGVTNQARLMRRLQNLALEGEGETFCKAPSIGATGNRKSVELYEKSNPGVHTVDAAVRQGESFDCSWKSFLAVSSEVVCFEIESV